MYGFIRELLTTCQALFLGRGTTPRWFILSRRQIIQVLKRQLDRGLSPGVKANSRFRRILAQGAQIRNIIGGLRRAARVHRAVASSSSPGVAQESMIGRAMSPSSRAGASATNGFAECGCDSGQSKVSADRLRRPAAFAPSRSGSLQ